MDFDLPEELVALREVAARFAAEYAAPYAQTWDREGRYPDSVVAALGEQGFLGALVPEEYGGGGGAYMTLAVILEELARADGGLALAVEAHNALASAHIRLAGSEAQKKRFLPSLATGKHLGCWCLTEPGAGTDAAALSSVAIRDGDDWVLSGSKQFITNGARAGIYVVIARTDPDAGREGISAFILERGTPGLTTGALEDKLGMRSSDTVAVHLEDCRVPADQLLGAEGHAFDDVKEVLEGGRIMISAVSLGLAQAAVDRSVAYANERETFGKAIIEHQLIQAKLADMVTQLHAARLLVYRSASRLDAGRETPLDSAMTKLFSSEMATKVCMDAIQVLGGYGYLKEYDVERFMRDAKLCEIGEGTSEILRVLIARSLRSDRVPGG
ncbi:MAG: acyl-CoA dehydrogenase family protein [Gemmatimonadota bacterium]|nr:acyl-CoA dehydrogenase family protein [Gemmatimonadota bacterium]MDH3422088.1 acyl-CoA dehydrogenase family protein [Gemmatimonadota bacterium]